MRYALRWRGAAVCGMSPGHADTAAVENTLVTEREPVAGFTRFQRTGHRQKVTSKARSTNHRAATAAIASEPPPSTARR